MSLNGKTWLWEAVLVGVLVETSRLSIDGVELCVLRVTDSVVGKKVRLQLLYAVVFNMSNKSFRAKVKEIIPLLYSPVGLDLKLADRAPKTAQS